MESHLQGTTSLSEMCNISSDQYSVCFGVLHLAREKPVMHLASYAMLSLGENIPASPQQQHPAEPLKYGFPLHPLSAQIRSLLQLSSYILAIWGCLTLLAQKTPCYVLAKLGLASASSLISQLQLPSRYLLLLYDSPCP